jgi:hypothetical protein
VIDRQRRQRLMFAGACGITALVLATYWAGLAGDLGLSRLLGTVTAAVAGLWLLWLVTRRWIIGAQPRGIGQSGQHLCDSGVGHIGGNGDIPQAGALGSQFPNQAVAPGGGPFYLGNGSA